MKFWLTVIFGATSVVCSEAFVQQVIAASSCEASALCAPNFNNRTVNTFSPQEHHALNTEALIPKQTSLILSQKPTYTLTSDDERQAYSATIKNDISQYDTIEK